MKFYLIRHGRQMSPLCNVDVPLAPEGRRQAELLGKRLEAERPDAVWSSGLLRAVETAEIANTIWNLPHVIRPDLREISFGDMEGMSDAEIVKTFGEFLAEKAKMKRDLPYPGGECCADVAKRVLPVFKEMEESGMERIAVITHGGVIRSLLCYFLGLDFAKNRLFASHLENCSITEIEKKEDGRYYVNRINDYGHLEPWPELLRSGWSGKNDGK